MGRFSRSGPPFPRPGWLPLPSHNLCEEPVRALFFSQPTFAAARAIPERKSVTKQTGTRGHRNAEAFDAREAEGEPEGKSDLSAFRLAAGGWRLGANRLSNREEGSTAWLVPA